ncbi:septum formation initiator family protein [Lysobacter korlensis]|uniref:Septum formation initiator family protein n=1 Tax=Lysobacter korlensis TaxID=553636 RepID=A0ABV6S2I4_9GAMM
MATRHQVAERPEADAHTGSAAGSWLRGFRMSGFTLTVLFLVIAGLVVLAPSLKVLVEQRAQIAELEREKAEAERTVAQLQEEVDRWSDPSFLKAQARDRLLYAFPGDITYLVIDDALPTQEGDGLPISDEIQTGQVDWVRSVVGSVMSAGLSDPEPQPAESEEAAESENQ